MNWRHSQPAKRGKPKQFTNSLQMIKKSKALSTTLTKCLAMDCEFVGITNKDLNSLARVSIVNYYGDVVYDKRSKVTDYRTWVSGITPESLKDAIPFLQCQKEVYNLIKYRILIGHTLKSDMSALRLNHPKSLIKDVSSRESTLCEKRRISLKQLAKEHLGIDCQNGSHCSV